MIQYKDTEAAEIKESNSSKENEVTEEKQSNA
jgi:hypothetical protein